MTLWENIRNNPGMLRQVLTDPAVVGIGLNRLYYEQARSKGINRSGDNIIENEDWDTLIILDACRYDRYAELTPFNGQIHSRESKGSASKQFVRGNFEQQKLHDMVAVSANQWYLKLEDEIGCEFHAYHDVDRDAADGLVASAEAVTDAALEVSDRYDDKRFLIHYMQPHFPYIETDVEGFDIARAGLRDTIRNSSVTPEDVQKAYNDNLRYVLDHVKRLVDNLDGKIVITADHGELLGERLSPVPVRWFGHPPGIYCEELIKVPWHVISDDSRYEITAEPPEKRSSAVDQSEVEQTLRDLGYKT